MDLEKIKKLQEMVNDSNRIVFFGGAGVSTESGIPDFRSVDGLYNQKYDYPPEEILSHTFFMRKTSEFYRFYKDKLLLEGAKPNKAHLKLAELEAAGKLKAVITQNIDGLHQLAGSKEVMELHGSVQRNYCMKCNTFYDFTAIKNKVDEASEKYEKGDENYAVPRCDKCGGI
ncbi:MAG: NAD-dependent protein deacylase, partial [Lachnospiraceae bacterium]|nr:NAD-dependent protein deacylase [Lachnospiraceae bacterium]